MRCDVVSLWLFKLKRFYIEDIFIRIKFGMYSNSFDVYSIPCGVLTILQLHNYQISEYSPEDIRI